jgi:hypothetical protein
MSRYCGDVDPEPIFRAAEHWRTQALSSDVSVLSNKSLWRLDHLEAIEQYYVMEVLLRIWVGHSTHGITDNYTVESLKADAEFRSATARKLA